ncbi:MAG: hypothetical protein ABI882_23065 [Acidobacteriota bacterium]
MSVSPGAAGGSVARAAGVAIDEKAPGSVDEKGKDNQDTIAVKRWHEPAHDGVGFFGRFYAHEALGWGLTEASLQP